MSNVTVTWGEAGTYWDVDFSEAELEKAGAFEVGIHRISVKIDPATGIVDLNPGYEQRSWEYGTELYLFRQNEDGIVAALVEELRNDPQPEYDRFRALHSAGPRLSR